jgi:hypothetical protein
LISVSESSHKNSFYGRDVSNTRKLDPVGKVAGWSMGWGDWRTRWRGEGKKGELLIVHFKF